MRTLGAFQAGRSLCLDIINAAQMQIAATSDKLKDFVAVHYSLEKSHVSGRKVSRILTNLVPSSLLNALVCV